MRLEEIYMRRTEVGHEYDDPIIQDLYAKHAPEGMEFEDWISTEEAQQIIQDYHERWQ